MPMLIWLPLILFGGMLNVAFDASAGLPERSSGEMAPDQVERAAPEPFQRLFV